MMPPSNDQETSFQAALHIESSAERLRAKVLAFLLAQGENGATDQEMQTALNLSSDTQAPRRWELSKKLGLVVDSGRRRKTRSGVNAIVWVVPFGGGGQ